jgi:DNA polymerase III epsilon subunit-like protein
MSHKFKITLDCETTGLPIITDKNFPNYKESKCYDSCRVIQISWTLSLLNTVYITKDYYLYHRDVKITNSEIHGITDEICKSKATDSDIVWKDLYNDLQKCDLYIGYNNDFDISAVCSELYRFDNKYEKMIQYLQTIKQFDVMKSSLIFYSLDKYMKLTQLYEKLFFVKLENAHNSINDVYATLRIFCFMVYNEKEVKYIKEIEK